MSLVFKKILNYTSLSGYWVDKREVGATTWQRVNIALCLPNQLNCSNLIEGRQYEFRVTAVNEAGLSPPSTASQQVKVVDPKGESLWSVFLRWVYG